MESKSHKKRFMSQKHLSTSNSALTQVEEIINEKRCDANSSGQHNWQAMVLMQAYAFLEPSIAHSTYDRYRLVSGVQSIGETKSWFSC